MGGCALVKCKCFAFFYKGLEHHRFSNLCGGILESTLQDLGRAMMIHWTRSDQERGLYSVTEEEWWLRPPEGSATEIVLMLSKGRQGEEELLMYFFMKGDRTKNVVTKRKNKYILDRRKLGYDSVSAVCSMESCTGESWLPAMGYFVQEETRCS
jgi:hypothetical protein